MSRIFGPIRQMGYIVRDIEKEMDHWIKVAAVGPWFYTPTFPVTNFRYDGGPPIEIEVAVALANSGSLQIELIQQKCRTPTMFTEFLDSGREGLQHWSTWQDDYDDVYGRALASGYRVAQEGSSSEGGRYAYFRAGDRAVEAIEISETTPRSSRFRRRIHDAAQDWDGRDPIRRL